MRVPQPWQTSSLMGAVRAATRLGVVLDLLATGPLRRFLRRLGGCARLRDLVDLPDLLRTSSGITTSAPMATMSSRDLDASFRCD